MQAVSQAPRCAVAPCSRKESGALGSSLSTRVSPSSLGWADESRRARLALTSEATSRAAPAPAFPKGALAARAATDLKEELKEYAAAERRWQSQITEGKVKSMTPREAGYSYKLADYVLLDVRPSFERQKGWVKDSVWVPAFDTDTSWTPGSAAKKLNTFLFGGWWNGNTVTKRNERFMPDVVANVPKGANVIVACQRGLRSLVACEQMYKAGYRNLFWINGGFDAAEEEDFAREGPEPLKFAGLGGVSEFVGWTDQQRRQAQKEGLPYRLKFFGRVAGLLVALDVAVVGFQQLLALMHPDQ